MAGVLALAIGATAVVSWRLLDRTPEWHPWLRYAVVAAAAVAIALVLAPRLTDRARAVAAVAAVAAALALGLGPAAYSLATAATPHHGSTPASGPSGIAGDGPGRMFGGAPGSAGAGDRQPPADGSGQAPQGGLGDGGAQAAPPAGFGGAGSDAADAALVELLQQDSGLHTWAAATVGTNGAAPLQLASGQSVMAIGGFNGGDPAPTLERFQQLVADGQIHWFVAGGRGGAGGGPGGGDGTGSAIQSWVAANFTAQTVGGTTVYDLTQAAATTDGSPLTTSY